MDRTIVIRSERGYLAKKAYYSRITQIWDSRRVLQLYPEQGRCCLGLNNKGRDENGHRESCGNHINVSDVWHADVLLGLMGTRTLEEVSVSGRLEDLARLLLCKNRHREGARSNVKRVVRGWKRLITQYQSTLPPRAEDGDQQQRTDELAPGTSGPSIPAPTMPFYAENHTTSGPGLQQSSNVPHAPVQSLLPAPSNPIFTSPVETGREHTHSNVLKEQNISADTNESAPNQAWCSKPDKDETRACTITSPNRVSASPTEERPIQLNKSKDGAKRMPGGWTEGAVEIGPFGKAFFGLVLFFGLLALLCCFVY